MGRTMTRKILEQKIGRCIETGQVYFFPVDCAMTHDVGTAGVAPLLEQYGTQALSPRVEMVVILDHFVPATTLSQAQSHKDARAFVRRWGVEHFYEIGRGGICHQVLLEKGHARSGDLLVATDAHVTTYGGVGCLGLGVGVTDVAMTLHTGLMWLKVPQAVGVRLEGALSHAAAKDLALYLLHLIPFSQLNYRVVEFYGPGVEGLTMDDRFCLCNMLSEGGVKSCLVAGDERTAAYMQARAAGPWTLVEPDLDADYAFRYELCLDDVRPMVAFPHHPTLGRDAAEAGGIPIDQAFLGSCTNGRNAVTSAALIPAFGLGVPGSSTAALFLSALMIQGLQPGYAFFTSGNDLFPTIVWGMLFAQVSFLVLGLLGARYFAKITQVPNSILVPFILSLSVVGSFALRGQMMDVVVMIIAGVAGYYLQKNGYPLACLILGLILGNLAEDNFCRAMRISRNSLSIFFTRPVSLILILIIAFSFAWPQIKKHLSKAKAQKVQ
ncbi:aconitase family protein [Intestinimonas butyriciproducens]|uniref:aconitase family protein n=1 Tax=Intestinimonas butyriciproducens TaxID=1297617 RepID=UPI00242B0688|nr:aconitase family protein [Intestinimonas butyriciproducens]MCI6363054.1 aconitase family protein [Intestinimonas butyriciproducens]MDY3615031.1 aconitase family protein [Intestinimonas butyriciproducens]